MADVGSSNKEPVYFGAIFRVGVCVVWVWYTSTRRQRVQGRVAASLAIEMASFGHFGPPETICRATLWALARCIILYIA